MAELFYKTPLSQNALYYYMEQKLKKNRIRNLRQNRKIASVSTVCKFVTT